MESDSSTRLSFSFSAILLVLDLIIFPSRKRLAYCLSVASESSINLSNRSVSLYPLSIIAEAKICWDSEAHLDIDLCWPPHDKSFVGQLQETILGVAQHALVSILTQCCHKCSPSRCSMLKVSPRRLGTNLVEPLHQLGEIVLACGELKIGQFVQWVTKHVRIWSYYRRLLLTPHLGGL